MATEFPAMISHLLINEFKTSVYTAVTNGVDVCLNCLNISNKGNVIHKTSLDCWLEIGE